MRRYTFQGGAGLLARHCPTTSLWEITTPSVAACCEALASLTDVTSEKLEATCSEALGESMNVAGRRRGEGFGMDGAS